MKNKSTLENINLPSNIISFYPDKKRIIERQNRIKDNDFTNLTKLVKNSVEKINDLFNQTDFQKKYKFTKKPSRGLKHGITDIEYDEINKINEIASKERASSLQKSSKTNFTFNINNFITVPNINPALPNITQINEEKINNSIEHNKKFDSKNENIKNSYLNITKKSTTSNIKKLNNNENNNFKTLNNSLFQIDEIQPNNSSMNNKIKTNLKMNNNKQKNIKLSIVNSRESKTIYNMSSKKISENPKALKEFDLNTPDSDDNNNFNNMILSGLSSITQNRKVIYRMALNNKKKENNINSTQKISSEKDTINGSNKYKIKQNENNKINHNKNNIKKNNEFASNKALIKQDKLLKSKKLFKTGDNFYFSKKDKEKNINNDINESLSNDDINKKTMVSKPHRKKDKIKNIKEKKNKQNTLNNINLKTVNDLNSKKYNKTITRNISDEILSTDSPNHINLEKKQKRGGSIPNERRFKKNDIKYIEFDHNSSEKIFNQVVNIFYTKEFPRQINTNEILKLMLFLNEYLISNNLLSDGQKKENKKLLNDYSKYISSKIKVDFPQEQDIVFDPSIKSAKKIQRKWRKRKIEKYLNKNKKSEINELKSMILNKYIQKSGNGVKKIIGLFNTILENFDNINKQPDINEMLYQIKKLIHNKLTRYEKNLLYKEYINSVIFGNNN